MLRVHEPPVSLNDEVGIVLMESGNELGQGSVPRHLFMDAVDDDHVLMHRQTPNRHNWLLLGKACA
jgi:hypothetical protein